MPRHAAVGAGCGTMAVPDIDYSRPGHYGGIELPGFAGGRPVRVVRIDDDLQCDRLDLVKIDVEGMEMDVLTGAMQTIERHRPMLYVENDRVDRSAALIELLLRLRHRLYWHLPPMFNPDNYFRNPANLYPNIVSVNMLCLPRERAQNVSGLAELTSPAEHPFMEPTR